LFGRVRYIVHAANNTFFIIQRLKYAKSPTTSRHPETDHIFLTWEIDPKNLIDRIWYDAFPATQVLGKRLILPSVHTKDFFFVIDRVTL
jgi:hypothetical protein